MKAVEKRFNALEQRNKRVELDKEWETSFTRKLIILVLTYIVVLLFFLIAELPKPLLSSLVPTAGFFLSTLTLPVFKKIWIRARK